MLYKVVHFDSRSAYRLLIIRHQVLLIAKIGMPQRSRNHR